MNSADDLFVYILMVKKIVAQISGRHLFEHWKAAHNFHWQVKVELFNTDAANAWEQIKTLLVNFGLTVKELKKTVVAVCFDGASGFKRELLVVHYVNHNFELAKKRKRYI